VDLAKGTPIINFDAVERTEKIAVGAYGAVYKGIYQSLDVAVKQFNTEVWTDKEINHFQSQLGILT